MKNLKYYLKKAQKEFFAIPQFNISTPEQIKGIVLAAKNLKSPLILGTSEGESKFLGLKQAVAFRDILKKETDLPIFLNLDHGKNIDYIEQAIDVGYDMVHFDGSKLPFQENIKITKQIKKYAKWRGVLLEGEIGIIGTESSKIYSESPEIKQENLTNPLQAKEYILKAKPDLLAIAIGNIHGIVENQTNPRIKLDVLKEIKNLCKNSFLVLHGGSGCNKNDIKESIKLGIVKININTELRMAYTNTIKSFFNKNPQEIVPYKYLEPTIYAIKDVCQEKIKLFNSRNKI